MKLKLLSLNLNQLILSNIYLGNNHRFFSGSMKMFLLGKRNFLDIINLKYTFLELKIVLSLIINLSLYKNKIFFFLPSQLMVLDKAFFNFNCLYFFGKWYGGLLTNFKKVFQYLFLKRKPQFSTNIDRLYFLPGLIFLFAPSGNENPLNESLLLGIPNAATLDGSSLLKKKVNYIIASNSLSLNAFYLYLYLFKEAFIYSKDLEKKRILSLI